MDRLSTADVPVRLGSTAVLPRRSKAEGEVQGACAVAQAVVAIALDGPGQGPDRKPARAAAFARQIAMYLAHVGLGISMAEIGRAFGRDRTTVVHACHVIEDRRDDARFDRVLDHLEEAVRALRAATAIEQGN
jgi:hypothetical protein